MKLYKVKIAGREHLMQLSEEEAQLRDDIVEATSASVNVELADDRAPSAKGESEDEMGRPLVESAAKENEERIARRKARAAANKARTVEDK